jgi:hypothetical protein
MFQRIGWYLAACWWLTAVSGVRADVVVHTPWVSVEVRQPEVVIQAPFVSLRIPRRMAAPASAARPALPLPPGDPPPIPVAPPPLPTPPATTTRAPATVPTLPEFASSFVPKPGVHEAVLMHPASGQPVKVRFLLPEGAPRRVRVFRYRLTFDYGRHDVALVFLRNGTVRVRN